MFKHFIFTRYNLGLYDKVKDADAWMRHRVGLFKRTAESMRAQTCKNFTWLIAFDPNTPDRYLDVPGTVIFENPLSYFLKLKPETEWVITSRLDNDDIVHSRWITDIQQAFRGREELIDFRGLKMRGADTKPNGRKCPTSMFISLIERWDNPKTVYYKYHSDMINYFDCRMFPQARHTVVIHDKNITNTW